MSCLSLMMRDVLGVFEHPLVMVGLAVCIFVGSYFLFRSGLPPGAFNMDPGGRPGEFERHLLRFQDMSKLVLTLSTASVAFLINFLVSPIPDSGAVNAYSSRLRVAGPGAITLLALSAVGILFFMVCESVFYEAYTHARFPAQGVQPRETHTREKYAVNLALAATGVLCFLLTFAFLACELFT